MRYENFKIWRVPILTLIGRSKRGLSRRFVTKDSLDSEWDFKISHLRYEKMEKLYLSVNGCCKIKIKKQEVT